MFGANSLSTKLGTVYRPLDKSGYEKNNFSTKRYVVGPQKKNRLNETILLSSQNKCLMGTQKNCLNETVLLSTQNIACLLGMI